MIIIYFIWLNFLHRYQECNCVSPFEWAARYVVSPESANIVHAPLCNMSSRCYSDAADRFQSTSSISGQFGADCGLECFNIEFPLHTAEKLVYNVAFRDSNQLHWY